MQEIWIEVLKDFAIVLIGGVFAFLFWLYKKNESVKEKENAENSEEIELLKAELDKKLDKIQITVDKTHEFVIRQDEKNRLVMERIEELFAEISSLWKSHNGLKDKVKDLLAEHKQIHKATIDIP